MDSDTSYGSSNNNREEYKQNSSGLLRFRSAPSSFFFNFTDDDDGGAEKISHGFNTSGSYLNNQFSQSHVFEDKKMTTLNFASSSSISRLPPQYPIPIPRPTATNQPQLGSITTNVGCYGIQNHGPPPPAAKMGSSLMRQNSSPAGLFSHPQNGSSNRFSSGTGMASCSLGMLSRISEVDNETGGANIDNNEKFGTRESQFYGSNFPLYDFSGLKRETDTDQDQNLFSYNQGGCEEETINQQPAPLLSHHLSLPNSSEKIAAMEKLLLFQDTVVPCKIRAKRGCATHPRSIAERVRRTRISERMKKLQDLVPNMDKQTNTADMLDLAVDYIKELQKQYKTLIDTRESCKCSAKQNSVSEQMF